jgi:hypothetical protein
MLRLQWEAVAVLLLLAVATRTVGAHPTSAGVGPHEAAEYRLFSENGCQSAVMALDGDGCYQVFEAFQKSIPSIPDFVQFTQSTKELFKVDCDDRSTQINRTTKLCVSRFVNITALAPPLPVTSQARPPPAAAPAPSPPAEKTLTCQEKAIGRKSKKRDSRAT